ncbi:MAG TPA: c-type cytochrome [Bacteroidetes bacterium]|jgi:tetratricopeptide (TPR) repeat protein|nr:c-type cytochrome [Bacteroidota bacterium]
MRGLLVAALTLAIFSSSLVAQQWRWPDQPKNLTVLPAATTAKELQRTMFSFTSALGVKCLYCHVGEEGKDWSEFDFPSDNKPEKDKARTMLKMMKAINTQYLSELPGHSATSLEVSCITCHRGNAVPILLEDKLKNTFNHHGIDSTINQYRALREQFYGGFTFNFKEGTLLRLADKIMEDTTKTSAAIQVLNLNIEMYPAFAFSYVHLASIYEDQGKVEAAIENYQQAIKLNPKDERLKKQLERLQGKK